MSDDVLCRRRVDELIGQMQTIDVRQAPDSMRRVRNDLLAHDAALRQRVEELEEIVDDCWRELTHGPTANVEYVVQRLDRARQALQEDDDAPST